MRSTEYIHSVIFVTSNTTLNQLELHMPFITIYTLLTRNKAHG